jgi:cyanophycin synthetase
VVLRNNANLSTGGTATDVTDDVHPEVAARAVAARRWSACTSAASTWSARTCCEPLEEQGGGIVEVNAAPGLRMHLAPSYGKGRAGRRGDHRHLFPTATTAASRWSPSPAPTARPPPCA